MIYAFCSDSSFEGLTGGAIVSHNDTNSSGLGVFTDELVNYFLTPSALVDNRNIGSVNSRITFADLGQANGIMKLQFDNTRTADAAKYTHIRPAYLDDEVDVPAIDAIATSQELKTQIFNIIEYAFLSHGPNGVPLSAEALDSAFRGEVSTFGKYVPGSLKVSTGTTESTINTAIGVSSATYHFLNSIEFEFQVTATVFAGFKIWLNQEAFLDEYPKTTLMKVIWPCDPAKLLDMNYTNTIETLVKTSSYKDAQLAPSIKDEDHSGLATYITRYVNNSVATYYRMPFTVLYKGNIPASSAMREYIAAELIDLNIASEAVWKQVLPDLFVVAGFYIVPMYSNRVEYGGMYIINKSIIDYSNIRDVVSRVYPNSDISKIMQEGVILMPAGIPIYLFAFPMDSNDDEYKDLDALIPNYQAIDATNPNFITTMSEITQEFARELAMVTTVALGLTEDNGVYTKEEIDNKNYWSFIVNAIEYHYLAPEVNK